MKAEPADYDSLVGQYKLDAPSMVLEQTGPVLTVSVVNERLFGEGKNQRSELIPQSANVFQAQGFPIRLTFIPGTDGRVKEVRLSFMGIREFVARRID